MRNNELTKAEALRLITPVVDGEVNDSERKAFLKYIATDENMRDRYESIKRVKNLIKERCPRARAPRSLRNKVKKYIRNQDSDQQSGPAPIYDIPTQGPSRQYPENTASYPRILLS